MKLSKASIEKLPLPATGQAFYRDDKLKGFAVRITASGSIAFVIEKRIEGKLRRYTLGKYPVVTVMQARKMAQIELGKIAQGIDTIKARQQTKRRHITLRIAYEDYTRTRKTLKATTLKNYNHMLQHFLSDWLNKPLTDLSKEMIEKRHAAIGKESPASANLTMRLLRAVFNYAIATYENEKGSSLIGDNPVKRLSQTRAWYKVARRDSVIKKHDLQAWYQGLCRLVDEQGGSERDRLLKDYFLFVLLTGLRRREAASLSWQQVDFNEKTVTIEDTKNGRKHILPLSSYLIELLQTLKEQSQPDSHFVFAADSRSGYIEEPRKTMWKITRLSGVEFTIHDLRRTFITIAESLDISVYALKRLLNHATANDVTAGYIILDVERLREPMQKITDYILKLMGIEASAKIMRLSEQLTAN